MIAPFASAEMFGPIAGQVYGKGTGPLVIVTHGDSKAGYIANFVATLAQNAPTATVIHMARPGYSLPSGERSKGSLRSKRNHHTRRNNLLLADGIKAAAQTFPHSRLIAVGHSGGGNQIGVIIGRAPGLIDTAVMIGTPYFVKRWRQMRGSPWPQSESPADFLKSVPRSTRIIAATGASDSNTVPALARDYVAKAKERGLDATFIKIPGAGHGWRTLNTPALKLVMTEIFR
ncbi:MAG: alpha/beta hydrolase family protein [Sedimentitalea sp.]